MFYLFHHMPKCGGTSFNAFLRSIFRVRPDYVGANHVQNPERFDAYKANPMDLSTLNVQDCISGHYNLSGISLAERYPDLESLPHRKFSILRNPLDAAASGIRYGIKHGSLPADLSMSERTKLVIARANYFARTFGVSNETEARAVFDRYWFVAPLDRLEHVMQVIELETGRKGVRPEVLNTTTHDEDPLPTSIVEEFEEKSQLDYYLYNLAQLRFGRFSAHRLDPRVSL